MPLTVKLLRFTPVSVAGAAAFWGTAGAGVEGVDDEREGAVAMVLVDNERVLVTVSSGSVGSSMTESVAAVAVIAVVLLVVVVLVAGLSGYR